MGDYYLVMKGGSDVVRACRFRSSCLFFYACSCTRPKSEPFQHSRLDAPPLFCATAARDFDQLLRAFFQGVFVLHNVTIPFIFFDTKLCFIPIPNKRKYRCSKQRVRLAREDRRKERPTSQASDLTRARHVRKHNT